MLDHVLNKSPVGIAVIDTAGNYRDVNPAYCRIYGYARELLIGQPFTMVLAVNEQDRVMALHRQFVFEGADLDGEWDVLRSDGKMLRVIAESVRVEDDQQQVCRLVYVVDITARKQAERALQASESRLSSILDSVMDAVVCIDHHYRICLFNVAAENMFGYPASAMLGEPLDRLLPQGVKGRHAMAIDEFAASGEARRRMGQSGQNLALNANGELFPVEVSISQTSIDGLKVYTAIVRDISETVQLKSELQVGAELLQGAFNAAALGFAFVSLEGRWMRVNPALCTLMGYSAEELLATDFQAVTHPDDLNADLEFVRQLLAGEISSYQMEKRYFHKDRHMISVLLAVSLVRNAKGEPLHFVSQIQDISAQKQYASELALAVSVATLGVLHWHAGHNTIRLDARGANQLGYADGADIAQRTLQQFFHPADLPPLLAAKEAFLQHGEPISLELRVRDHSNSFVWVGLRMTREDPLSDNLMGVFSNITPRKEAEVQVQLASGRLKTLLESLPDTVLAFDTGGFLSELHPSADDLQRFEFGNWKGLHHSDVFPSEISATLDATTVDAWEGPGPKQRSCELVTAGVSQHFTVTVSQLTDGGKWPTGFLATIRDETQRYQALLALQQAAYHDPLTELPNRRMLNDRLMQARAKSEREDKSGALLILDLDKFKVLNDTHGHDAGDRFLQEIAKRLVSAVRAQDTVARLGGDEFAILIEGLEKDACEIHVQTVMQKIRQVLEPPCDLITLQYPALASIGHALFHASTPDNDTIFALADARMYADKAARRA